MFASRSVTVLYKSDEAETVSFRPTELLPLFLQDVLLLVRKANRSQICCSARVKADGAASSPIDELHRDFDRIDRLLWQALLRTKRE